MVILHNVVNNMWQLCTISLFYYHFTLDYVQYHCIIILYIIEDHSTDKIHNHMLTIPYHECVWYIFYYAVLYHVVTEIIMPQLGTPCLVAKEIELHAVSCQFKPYPYSRLCLHWWFSCDVT